MLRQKGGKRKKVIEINPSGEGYRVISAPLGRTTVRAIICKWRKLGTVVNLPRSGRPTRLPPTAHWRFIREIPAEPRRTSKELWVVLVSCFWFHYWKETGRVRLLGKPPQQIISYHLTLAKISPWNSLHFLEDLGPVPSGISLPQLSTVRRLYWQSDMVGVLLLWGCLAASSPLHYWWKHEFFFFIYPEKGVPVISPWFEA